MKGLPGMVMRRVRKLLAWAIALGVLALIAAGAYFLLQLA